MTSLKPLLFAPIVLAACGGESLSVGTNYNDAGSDSSDSVPDGAPFGLDGGLFNLSFTPAEVQVAQANCAVRTGSPLPVSTFDAGTSWTSGAWFVCQSDAGISPGSPVSALGIAFASDGSWIGLNSDGKGGLVSEPGTSTEGSWGLQCGSEFTETEGPTCSSASSPLTLMIGARNSSVYPLASGGTVTFEVAPLRMHTAEQLCAATTEGECEFWLAAL